MLGLIYASIDFYMEEKDLISLLKNESTRSRGFDELVRQYQERIYWHIRKIVVVHEDTDDVIQNTFIKIFRGIDKFKGDSKLYTWIYRIATNESITFLNKRSRMRSESIDSDQQKYLLNSLKSDTHFCGDEITRNLMIAINQLPQKQKLVFQMKYLDDMTFREISEILGTSIGALKASFHHATKKVTEALDKIEFIN